MILIYGKGRVGQAVARLCEYQHIPYYLCDDTDAPTDLDPYDIIIPSPGIAPTHRIYQTLRVICELDWASQWLPTQATTIAITGTDGKSTTAWIMYQILLKEGEKSGPTPPVFLSGNFEIPFSETIREILERGIEHPQIVIEISSFMAYSIEQFSPDYTIFTNFAPDHLNWHPSLQDYLDSKWKLVSRAKQGAGLNTQILDQIDHLSLQIPSEIDDRVHFFTDISSKIGVELSRNHHITDGEQIILSPDEIYHLGETHFSGVHNAMNLLACATVARSLGLDSSSLREHLTEITGLPHRIEQIAEKGGIRFIEDSKSTSCQSLRAALSAFDHTRLVLIAGGSDKGDPFEGLEQDLQGVAHIILIGATAEILSEKSRLAGVSYSFAESMREAVEQGVEKALLLQKSLSGTGSSQKQEVFLLLSPGCASFGMFTDYLDRARQFRAAVEGVEIEKENQE